MDVATLAVQEAERLGHQPSRWSAFAALAEARSALGEDQAAADAHLAATRSIDEFAGGLTEGRRTGLFERADVAALLS